MLKISSLAFATVATIIAATAPAQAAACQYGICASSSAQGAAIVIRAYVKGGGVVSHVNLRTPNGRQQEGAPRATFYLPRFPVTRYALQACVRGSGPFSRSTCGPWAHFHHNDR